MKVIFRVHGVHTKRHHDHPGGHEFIATVKNIEEFQNKVFALEGFEKTNGAIDPHYPQMIEMKHYSYVCTDVAELTETETAAVKKANPANINDILVNPI